MSGFALHTLTNYQPQPTVNSPRLLAVVAVMSIALAAAPFATATRIGGAAENASVVRIDAAGAYHHARVLEPGSRGSVVEI
jgi:hypothetical protein